MKKLIPLALVGLALLVSGLAWSSPATTGASRLVIAVPGELSGGTPALLDGVEVPEGEDYVVLHFISAPAGIDTACSYTLNDVQWAATNFFDGMSYSPLASSWIVEILSASGYDPGPCINP